MKATGGSYEEIRYLGFDFFAVSESALFLAE
jgi:hypothetical protein